jgi:putative transposase
MVKAFLDRPIEGDWPYLWLDATFVKVRQASRVVSAAVIVAVGVSSDGRREVLGMDIGPSEAETFWTEFLRKLARRGLRGVKPSERCSQAPTPMRASRRLPPLRAL